MAQLSEKEVANQYASLMGSAKWRMEALQRLIRASIQDTDWVDRVIKFEAAVLQVRQVCETVAIAVLTAHQVLTEATTNRFTDKWNADALLGLLKNLNEDAFPLRMEKTDPINGIPNFKVSEDPDVITREKLCYMYNRCGELLHVGSLKKLLKGQRRDYDTLELVNWNNSLTKLLEIHVVPLPEFQRSLLCIMNQTDNGKVGVWFSRLTEITSDAADTDRWQASGSITAEH